MPSHCTGPLFSGKPMSLDEIVVRYLSIEELFEGVDVGGVDLYESIWKWPNTFQPKQPFPEKYVEGLRKKIKKIQSLTEEKARQMALAENREARDCHQNYIQEKNELRRRFSILIRYAEEWKAPAVLRRLKKDILNHLKMVMPHEPSPQCPGPLSGKQWKDKKTKELEYKIRCEEELHKQGIMRAKELTKIVKDLKYSLRPFKDKKG